MEKPTLTGKKKPGLYYGYIVVICSFIIIFTAFGINYSFGVFFNPLLADFGWSRAVTSVGYSLGQIASGALGIFAGRITDSFGPRLTGIISGFSLALGCFLMSRITEVWQFYLIYGILVGIGIGGTMVPLISTVSRWFIRLRGAMTGIVVSGIGTATIIFPLLVNYLLSVYHWRTSFIIMGGIALILILPAAIFLKRDPAKIGVPAYGQDEPTLSSSIQGKGLSLRDTIHTASFWIVCMVYFLVGFYSQTIMVHIVPHARALGIAATSAAVVLSLVGGGSIAGRIIMGGASDRIGVKTTLIIALSITFLGFIWLQPADELWMLYLFAPVYGFAYGALIALQALSGARLFGLVALGIIVGMISFSYAVGGAIGPIIAGYIFDITGNYQAAFIICAILAFSGLVLVVFLRQPHKVRKE
jgi:MFS family permease